MDAEAQAIGKDAGLIPLREDCSSSIFFRLWFTPFPYPVL